MFFGLVCNFSVASVLATNDLIVDDIMEEIYINGKYFTKKEIINLLSKSYKSNILLESHYGSINNNIFVKAYSDTSIIWKSLAGTYWIPGIGKVVITVAGVIIIGDAVKKTGTWLYNQVVNYFKNNNVEEESISMTADEIISKFRKVRIRREFPSEFLYKTIEEIMNAASRGNANARKALKLLRDGRFKK